MRAGNQGSHDSGVHSRTAWNAGVDLRRRHHGYLVTRSAEASCQPAGGLRSAQERTDEGWQPERSGGCTQLGRAATQQPSPCGVPREAWNPCFKRVGAELLDAHQGQSRVMNRIKSVYRSWAIPCAGTSVYSRRHRAEWLAQLLEPGVRIRAEHLYEQLDSLPPVRQAARRELLRESRKHAAVKLLRQIPAIGPIRSALLVAILQTPHRFRTKRQLWAYSGFAVQTCDSGEYRFVRGKLQRNRERITVRGLNHNHNHDLKNLLKGAAITAIERPGPLQDFYAALVDKGIRPSMARLTLARKIAAITLTIWKKGVSFDPKQLQRQAA